MSYGQDLSSCLKVQQVQCFKAPCPEIQVYDNECVRRISGNLPWWWKLNPVNVSVGNSQTTTEVSSDYKPYYYVAAALAILLLGWKLGK